MADAPTLEVKGAAQLADTLKAAGDELADMKAANEAVGSMVVGKARALAPKVSGALAASVSATVVLAGIDVAADAVYAGPIHWGWPAHNIAAQPFIQEAILSTEPQTLQLYEDEVNRILSQVKGDESA